MYKLLIALALLLMLVTAKDAEEMSLFNFGSPDMKQYDVSGSLTPEYKFPKYSEDKMPVNLDSAIITETHFQRKAVKTNLRHAWTWDHKQFQKIHTKFSTALKKFAVPFTGKKCTKSSSSEIQLLNSCLYDHLRNLNDATQLAIACIQVDDDGAVTTNKFNTQKNDPCYVGGADSLSGDLVSCCHAKLEKKTTL